MTPEVVTNSISAEQFVAPHRGVRTNHSAVVSHMNYLINGNIQIHVQVESIGLSVLSQELEHRKPRVQQAALWPCPRPFPSVRNGVWQRKTKVNAYSVWLMMSVSNIFKI